MLMAGYSAALGLGLLASAPWWLLRMATTQRYREGLLQRLGAVPARLRAAVAGKRVVWVHAVSVGEVLAVSRLVAELEAALNGAGAHLNDDAGDTDQRVDAAIERAAWTVVISTTTRTGQDLARARFGAERVFYFPLDFAFAVRAFLRVLRPAMVVLAESELWPRLLAECERSGVPVAVVNARVSDRSFRRALRVRKLWGRLLRKVTLWLAQSEDDAKRLLALGAGAAAVRVSGNLKFEVRAPKSSKLVERIAKAAGGRPLIVAGSTVAGLRKTDPSEDSPLIRAWEGSLRDAGVVLVLAPRHPENYGSVYSIAIEYPTLLATEMLAHPEQILGSSSRLRDGERRPVEIIVLDTIGDLAAVYGLAQVAFVGGSLLPRGGHNPLEPAQFGVPVVMGPSFENFREIVRHMRDNDGIPIVQNSDDLAATLQHLINHPEIARKIGERGRAAFEKEQGATSRSVAALLLLLIPTVAAAIPEAVPA